MKNTKKNETALTLIRDEEGGGFIEKIIIIGLFVFVVAAGVTYIAGKASNKLNTQGDSVEGVNDVVGGGGGGGGS